MALSVKNLQVSRGGIPLLEDVNFEVPDGTALILHGPNGIGKTSLLRTLGGLQDVDAGDVTVDEDDVAYASHADGVKAQLTVVENLEFWAQVHGCDVAASIYDDFDLADLKPRLAGTLSAGQKRRLGLARLGTIGRKILLLDEPTVSLDAFSVKLFVSFLKDKHLANGGSAVIATHIDLELDAPILDLSQFKASPDLTDGEEAFL